MVLYPLPLLIAIILIYCLDLHYTATVRVVLRVEYYNNVSILRLPDIPPDANITYELELLDVQPPLDFETIAEEELLKLV